MPMKSNNLGSRTGAGGKKSAVKEITSNYTDSQIYYFFFYSFVGSGSPN